MGSVDDEQHHDSDIEEMVSTSTIARPGSNNSAVLSVKSLMRSKKADDTFELQEDMYALIFVAPVFSGPFLFASYVITLKLIIYGILVSDISWSDVESASISAWSAKFFLIPVALSMQADLMHVFFCLANVLYCPSILETSSSATKSKLYLSWMLRCVDGIFSLCVNFFLMLVTAETLSVFTNFAALYFLQDIDDVFYGLVQLGFFGDKLEYMSQLCAGIEFPRREGTANGKFLCFRISHMDSILWALAFVILTVIYIVMCYITFQNFSE